MAGHAVQKKFPPSSVIKVVSRSIRPSAVFLGLFAFSIGLKHFIPAPDTCCFMPGNIMWV